MTLLKVCDVGVRAQLNAFVLETISRHALTPHGTIAACAVGIVGLGST